MGDIAASSQGASSTWIAPWLWDQYLAYLMTSGFGDNPGDVIIDAFQFEPI